MKYWQAVSYTHPDELLEIAPVAEEAGFEGINLSDHLLIPQRFHPGYPYSEDGMPDFDATTLFPEVWSTVTALAQGTRKLRFATGVFILPLRHPVEVAKAVANAAIFSQGRVVLGIGAGWLREEFEVQGIPFAGRGKRMDEAIAVIQKLLTGDLVEHRGEHYAFGPSRLCPAPKEPVPIWVGGRNPAALRRAATQCDGWTGAGNTVAEAREILSDLGGRRRAAGREQLPFEAVVPLVEEATPEQLAELVELGMTSTVNYPFRYTCALDATLQQKLDMMRRFGDEVISRA